MEIIYFWLVIFLLVFSAVLYRRWCDGYWLWDKDTIKNKKEINLNINITLENKTKDNINR